MSSSGPRSDVWPIVGFIAVGIIGVLGLLVFALAIVSPEAVTRLDGGGSVLVTDVTERIRRFAATLHVRPVLDVFLLAGAYTLVCGLIWLQDELNRYLANRSHFR